VKRGWGETVASQMKKLHFDELSTGSFDTLRTGDTFSFNLQKKYNPKNETNKKEKPLDSSGTLDFSTTSKMREKFVTDIIFLLN